MDYSIVPSQWIAAIAAAMLLAVAAPGGEQIFLREEFENLDRWKPLTFPAIHNHSTYTALREGDHSVLRTESRASASGIMLSDTFDVQRFPLLAWRWKVDRIYPDTNPQLKSGDDYPIRIYVVFEYDPAQASFATRMKYRLAKTRYGEYPPQAALNYVWASAENSARFYFSPYSDRSAMIPLEVGSSKVGRWVEERVNIAEDYRRIFGGEPPARASLAIMNDSDNTGAFAVSYIDDIEIRVATPGK